MAIDEQLKALCEEHELTCISLIVHAEGRVRVFLHWENNGCASGVGTTFGAAFDEAMAQKPGAEAA